MKQLLGCLALAGALAGGGCGEGEGGSPANGQQGTDAAAGAGGAGAAGGAGGAGAAGGAGGAGAEGGEGGGAGGQGGGAGGQGGAGAGGGAGGSGGAGAGGGAGGAGGGEPCMPPEDVYTAVAAPLIEAHCGECHGEVPQFGAGISLHTWAGLMAGEPGQRKVDRIVARLRAGTMPPPAQPRLEASDLSALIDWASCGDMGDPGPGPNPGGVDATAPPHVAPAEPPEGTSFFEFRADRFDVPKRDDYYECFVFRAPVDAERFIRRIEPAIGDSRVVHHLVLMRGGENRPEGSSFECYMLEREIYAWAPGMGPLQFPEGGIRMAPGESYLVQVHYNNRTHLDVRDTSGVRIYHGPTEGPEVGLVTLGPNQFRVPAGQRGSAEGHCTLPDDVRVIASWPHMHEIGHAFDTYVVHPDGTETELVRLRNWDFHGQYVYDTPAQLAAGDRIVTRCTWQNTTNRAVGFGSNTDDEMCFNFLYHTPPLRWHYCNEPPPPDVNAPYEIGACGPPEVDGVVLPLFRGGLRQGEPVVPPGARPVDGLWHVRGAAVYLPTFQTPIGEIDGDESWVRGEGVVKLEGDVLTVDFDVELHVQTLGGQSIDLPLKRSFRGSLTGDAVRATFANSCGESTSDRVDLTTVEDGTAYLGFVERFGGGINLEVGLQLEPRPAP